MSEHEAIEKLKSQRMSCIGVFMDEQAQLFSSPSSASNWASAVSSEDGLSEEDQAKISRAMNLLESFLRKTAMASGAPPLHELLPPDKVQNIKLFDPDERAALLMRGNDEPVVESFARTVTVLKEVLSLGMADSGFLVRELLRQFDDMPTPTKLDADLVKAARRMVELDFCFALNIEPEEWGY